MRFVQQPILTCWHASMSCPVTGSENDDARPPSRGRDSMTVTANPRSASATAADSPAKPPPTIARVGWDKWNPKPCVTVDQKFYGHSTVGNSESSSLTAGTYHPPIPGLIPEFRNQRNTPTTYVRFRSSGTTPESKFPWYFPAKRQPRMELCPISPVRPFHRGSFCQPNRRRDPFAFRFRSCRRTRGSRILPSRP